MKKVLLIIFLFIFLGSINVYASDRSFKGAEFISDIYYKKYNGEVIQYRRAQVIRDTATGEIAYCVEPFDIIGVNSYYDESSYYDPIYGISEDMWEKLKLYSYYGYGYKDHDTPKWINITQMAIWRALFPNFKFVWIDSLETQQEIPGFYKEIEELNTLVNNHGTLPSIKGDYVVSINDTLELKDTNNVLNNYKIKSSDFDARIENDKLVVNVGDEVKEGTIYLERGSDKFFESVKYFYSTQSQNVMERGNIEPVKVNIKINVETGKIIVNKIDSETKEKTPQGEGSLDGSIFVLLNENKEVLKELEIKNNTLEFTDLPFGKYYVKEKEAGNGYYLNKEEYENNTMKKEANIAFVIYDKNRNVVFSGVTNCDGEIVLELPYGDYEIEQVNTTSGYDKVDNYKFTINEESSVALDIVLNDYKINVPNANIGMVRIISDIAKEQVCSSFIRL